MNRELYIHTLSQFRDECERKHMGTETEAFNAAIQALSADGDCISRQAAIDMIEKYFNGLPIAVHYDMIAMIHRLPSAQPEVLAHGEGELSAQPEQTRVFVELVVEYPDPELCTYKEFKGKPYYSIKYIENGETYVGYGTYNPEVLSRYLREYFMPSAQPEPQWISCKDRLPDKNQICIVTDDKMDITYEYGFHPETYDEVNGWTYLGHKIIAWMPLPEPYKEKDNEKA